MPRHAARVLWILTLLTLAGCQTVVRDLDFARAAAAGAVIYIAGTPGPPACVRGVRDAMDLMDAKGAILFTDCNVGPLLPADNTVGDFTTSLLTEFRLKNGWKIKSVDTRFARSQPSALSAMSTSQSALLRPLEPAGLFGFQWITQPTPGSTDTTSSGRLWTGPENAMYVYLHIQIEGNPNFDPYDLATFAGVERQELSLARARAAGATFNLLGQSVGACHEIGVKDGATEEFVENRHVGANFWLNCGADATLSIPSLTGGTATLEAFKDFTLKNGWKVKDVTVSFPFEFNEHVLDSNSRVFKWLTRPQESGTDPYIRVFLSANAGEVMMAKIAVTIEGPSGTDPYN
jgi:hypothetical protein